MKYLKQILKLKILIFTRLIENLNFKKKNLIEGHKMSFAGTITLDSSGIPDFNDFSGHNGAITIDCSAASLAYNAFNGNTTFESAASVQFTGQPMSWQQVGDDFTGEAIGDRAGFSFAISNDGSRIAFGAPYNDASGSDAGHVRIYERSGTAWVQVGANIDGEAAGDQSGSSIALSSDGSRVAIGAWLNDGSGISAGHVRIYDWNGTAWVQVGTDIDGEAEGDVSGTVGGVALSSDGSRVAIGSPGNDGIGNNAGHVRIYEEGSDMSGAAWVQVGEHIDGEVIGDESGSSIALSSDGSRIAIGAPWNNGGASGAGHVRIYEEGIDSYTGNPAWEQVGEDIDGEGAGDASGYRLTVSINSDCSRIAIGSRRNDENGSPMPAMLEFMSGMELPGCKWALTLIGDAAGD